MSATASDERHMIWLALGLVLWAGVHLVPSLDRPLRSRLIDAVGEAVYKIGFSLAIVGSIALMVIGWQSAATVDLYHPPAWTRPVTIALMLAALVLIVAARHPTVLKRHIRHPQLSGVIVWAVAHLISNGDQRALLLFGGLGLWALIEIASINARDGIWVKPVAPSMGIELRGLAIGVIAFALILFLHPYFTGVAVVGG